MKSKYDEINTHYVTNAEKFGIEKGIKIGLEQGVHIGERNLLKLLIEKKFGKLSITNAKKLNQMNASILEELAQNLLFANTIEEIFLESEILD